MKTPLLLFACLAAVPALAAPPPSLRFSEGPVNAIAIERGGRLLAVNRLPEGVVGVAERVLLTHARREVVEAARASGAAGVLFAPEASREFLEGTASRWESWWDARFDYYKQQVTRLPMEDLAAERYLKDGDTFVWEGLEFRFLAAPGYTRDGGAYLTTLDGVKTAFTGDLILSGGRVPDLYSFQEEIPEAKVGGYHGYLGRLAQWLGSLEALAETAPGLIVSSRGPLIENPAADLAAAAETARKIYRSYLETNALHWYFGEERMKTCADRVLGPGHGVAGMPFAEHVDLPSWCQHIGTTKLLVAESGRGFVLDVGGPASLKTLIQYAEEGLVKGIDGIFVTHTHNDHTAAVAEAARHFRCPVYATPEVAPVLVRPGDWFLPGVSPNAVDAVKTRGDGDSMEWEGFRLTFRSFPGQMLNHGALLVEKEREAPVFFIGDSFSPSGIDDYCLMNRNLLREDSGYLRCFAVVESLPGGTWLVNQHIPHRFRFSPTEREFLLGRYRERIGLIAGFTPWDDPNYAVDEQWAWFLPYGSETAPGSAVRVDLRICNHSTVVRVFEARLRGGWTVEPETGRVRIPPRGEGTIGFSLTVPGDAPPGLRVITADLSREDGMAWPHWCETLVRVIPP